MQGKQHAILESTPEELVNLMFIVLGVLNIDGDVGCEKKNIPNKLGLAEELMHPNIICKI